MRIMQINVDDLKPYENNARKNKAAVAIVKQSINKYGFRNPILIDENKVIIAGHTRLEAAIELGIIKVPVIEINDLTENQIKAFRIMDNKSGEFAQWDKDLLREEFHALEDTDEFNFTGFSSNEITSIWDEKISVNGSEEEATKVEHLGKIVITCPKCDFKFKRKD